MESANIDLDSVKSKMVRLRNEKDEANDRADKLDQELRKTEESKHQVLNDRDDLQRKIQNLEAENGNLQEANSTANNKLEEAAQKEKDYDHQVAELNTRTQGLEKTEEEMLAELKALQDKLEVADTSAANFERDCNKFRMENEKMEKDLATSEEKFMTMQESLRDAMSDLNNV